MRSPNQYLAFLSVLLVAGNLPVPTPAREAAEATPVAKNPADPEILTKELAAVKAFRAMIASYSYQLPEEKVREVILDCLRAEKTSGPKETPAVAKFQDALDFDFESLWESMVAKTTEGLDPEGTLELENRLRDYLARHPSLRVQAEKEYAAYVENDLSEAVSRACQRTVEEQTVELRKTLEERVGAGIFAQETVYKAVDGKRQAAGTEVAEQVIREIAPATRRVLLQDSVKVLESEIGKIIEDGVYQFEEQMLVFELRPEAVSRPGIEKELERKMALLVERQRGQREATPLKPHYGRFNRVADVLPERAAAWFDECIAEEGARSCQGLAEGRLGPARRDAQRLQESILGAPAVHHDREESLVALEADIEMLCESARAWIHRPLEAALNASDSPEDRDYSVEVFRREVERLLDTDGTKANAAWGSLSKALRSHVTQTLLPEIRSSITDEQATLYAPLLAGGHWFPTEEELKKYRTPLNPVSLAKLSFWRDRPPPFKNLLEETWQRLGELADRAFLVGADAMRIQNGLASDLKPTILARMRAQEERNAAEWVAEYTAEVATRWKRDSSELARNYPVLFDTTRDMIAGIVSELLETEAVRRDAARNELAKDFEDEGDRPSAVPIVPDIQPAVDIPIAETASAAGESTPVTVGPAKGPETAGDSGLSGETPFPTTGGETGDRFGGGGRRTRFGLSEGSDLGEADDAWNRNRWGPARWSSGPDLPESDGSSDSRDMPSNRGSSGGGHLNPTGGHGERIGDRPGGGGGWFGWRFYRIGFWTLLLLILIQSGCWYWNVRYMYEYIEARRRSGEAG